MNLMEFYSHPVFENKYKYAGKSLLQAEQMVMTELDRLFGNYRTITHAVAQALDYNVLPYHNLNHVMLVAANCLELYSLLESRPDEHEQKALIMAALFHDAGHSGGKLLDCDNIKNACKILTEFSKAHPTLPFDVKLSCSIIEKTEFMSGNFTQKSETILQDIMRDADLLACFGSSCLPSQLHGLRKEMGWDVTDEELIQNNLDFIKRTLFYTEPAFYEKCVYVERVEEALNCKE